MNTVVVSTHYVTVQVGLLSLSAACCAALGLAVGALVPGQVTTFYVLTYLLTH